MKLLRSFIALLLIAMVSFSCTKQDLNEEETLTNDTEVFATGGDNGGKEDPPPPGQGS
ncbi:hypothetical protein [Seonamhaeicola marinus]|uniref:hypothetical protein n=1 Tax=Seonamhaeicola marinus TaxID=1912246 RepID=UPI001651FDF4|nr:hypothetical protein [Seonamhaeicola marinus]